MLQAQGIAPLPKPRQDVTQKKRKNHDSNEGLLHPKRPCTDNHKSPKQLDAADKHEGTSFKAKTEEASELEALLVRVFSEA